MATYTNGANGSAPATTQPQGEEETPARRRARSRERPEGAAERTPKPNFIRPAVSRDKGTPPRERTEVPSASERDAKTPKDRNELGQALDMKSMPEEVRRRYTQDGQKYYLSNGERAFVDHGARLTTRSENTAIVRDLVAVASARGWNEIEIGGTKEFRKEAWREAKLAGLNVIGYKPSRAEQAMLIDKLIRSENSPQKESSPAPDGPTRAARAPRPRRENADLIVGELVKHGPAPFKHDARNESSYYVLLKTRRGSREIWGVDLKRAIEESRTYVHPGDEVGLRHVSRRDFMKKTPHGEVEAHRNGWIIEGRQFFDDRVELAKVFRDTSLKPSDVTRKHPELKGSYLKLQEAKLQIEKSTKNPEDRARFVARTREEMAAAMQRGEDLTPVRMREHTKTPAAPAKPAPTPEHLLSR